MRELDYMLIIEKDLPDYYNTEEYYFGTMKEAMTKLLELGNERSFFSKRNHEEYSHCAIYNGDVLLVDICESKIFKKYQDGIDRIIFFFDKGVEEFEKHLHFSLSCFDDYGAKEYSLILSASINGEFRLSNGLKLLIEMITKEVNFNSKFQYCEEVNTFDSRRISSGRKYFFNNSCDAIIELLNQDFNQLYFKNNSSESFYRVTNSEVIHEEKLFCYLYIKRNCGHDDGVYLHINHREELAPLGLSMISKPTYIGIFKVGEIDESRQVVNLTFTNDTLKNWKDFNLKANKDLKYREKNSGARKKWR
ncbi:hypothetical protein [Chitinophaga silvisoli]|uniref:Uncharacterized protein n=1 Tax=Chitinophaga silvisoli TaxID=2291814 RepID=A0A3E1P2Q5_9BACT|nr:hypothetical protein [Chitinophaga silvisoli]RFM34452.1 hypothetical protein DXN04_14335 [Chitinophaga silvisoli]